MQLHLSPSQTHAYLRQRLVPSLSYRGGPVDTWQGELRTVVGELLGMPDGERPPLAVRKLWDDEVPAGVIEKIAFTAEPYADVVGYFCRPRHVAPPYPVMICLQGHTTGMHHSIARQRDDERLPVAVDGDRDFALSAMRHGFAALCIEQRSFGERREQHQERLSPHGCHDAAMHALMLGRTLLGERVYDVDRGIDYLAERDDVDLARIGVMGNSGGGTVSIYSAALLDRIAFAMPSCAFCTFGDSVMGIYHCADNYVPGLLRYADSADILGLVAPRPVVVVAGREDPIFPIAGVTEAFGQLRRIYAAADAEDRCQLVVGDGGHRFYADQGWAALTDLV